MSAFGAILLFCIARNCGQWRLDALFDIVGSERQVSAVDYKAAARDIHKGTILPVYVCYGTEKYLMNEFIAYLTNKLIEPDQKEFALSKFDLAESSLQTVIEDAETPPFLVPRKLIVAKDALFLTGAKDTSKVEHKLDRLMEYADKPVDYSVIVLTVHAEKLDERKKVVKLLKDRGFLVPFSPLGSEELLNWVKKQAEKQHCSFGGGAAEKLIVNAGTNLQSLAAEVDKLCLFVGSGETIAQDMVDSLVVRNTEQNIFVLIEHIANLRLDQSFAIFYDLLKQREEPIKIMSLIARQFRIMLQVKELVQQSYSQQQIASQIGVHPYAVKLAAEQARKFDIGKLGRVLADLAQLDYEMKTGRVDKVLGLELLLLKLA